MCPHRGGLLSIYDHGGGGGVECVLIEGDYCLYMTMGGWGGVCPHRGGLPSIYDHGGGWGWSVSS